MATGEIAGILFPQADQADRGQHFKGFVADLRFLLAYHGGAEPGIPQVLPKLSGRDEHEVFEHRHVAKLAWNLKGATDAMLENLVRRQASDILAVEEHPTAIGFGKAG